MQDPRDRLRKLIARLAPNNKVAAAQIGCDPATLCRILQGKSPRLDTAKRIEEWSNGRIKMGAWS